MDEISIFHFQRGDHGCLDLGDIGCYQETHTWSVGQQAYTNKGFELCSLYTAPKLIGDYQMHVCEQPNVSYFICVCFDDIDCMSVTTGCLIITHRISFSPIGIVSQKSSESSSIKNGQNYFINQIQYGGRFMQGNRFKKPKDVTSLLQQETIFFANDSDGIEGFKNKLCALFFEVQTWEIIGLFCSSAPQIRTDTFGPFGPINAKQDQEKREPISREKRSLKMRAKNLLEKKRKPKKEEESLQEKRWHAAESRLKDLHCYVQAYLEKNPDGNPQISKATGFSPLMLLKSPTYQKIKLESFSQDLFELEAMYGIYTVNLYEKMEERAGHFTCRIDVYPNKRDGFYQIVSSTVTWISAEASGESLHSSLLEAFSIIRKKLEHMKVQPQKS